MGLLIAFILGGLATVLVFELSRRRAGPSDGAMLDALRAELFRFEGDQKASAAALGERMQSFGEHQATVVRQTGQLAEALRRPGVRGQWGELTLRNVVEAAGLAEHVDFDVQVHVPAKPTRRPSDRTSCCVCRAGDTCRSTRRSRSTRTSTPARSMIPRGRRQHLGLHVKAVRARVRELSAKAYWDRFERSPEMVILFMPSEAAFAAALQQRRRSP